LKLPPCRIVGEPIAPGVARVPVQRLIAVFTHTPIQPEAPTETLRQRFIGASLLVGVALILVVPSFAALYTDWLWFLEVGHEQVFVRTLRARLLLGGVVFLVAFAVLYANVWFAQGALRGRALTVVGPQGVRTIAFDMGRLRPLFYLGATVAALLIAMSASGKWDVWLMARNAVPFGTNDPILGYDISFYLFQLPFLQFSRTWR
jgi:uncharacterized membrane protein (UPF0182 family)